jgi:hypothetical protein
MVFIETEVNSEKPAVVKVLLTIDDYNQLMVEKTPYEPNTFKIFNYDSLTKTTSQLANFVDGKYIIYNEMLFDEYYLKPLKNNKKMVKELQSFIRADYNMDGFKKFNIKFSCFRRRVNISVTKFIRKTKRVIWE